MSNPRNFGDPRLIFLKNLSKIFDENSTVTPKQLFSSRRRPEMPRNARFHKGSGTNVDLSWRASRAGTGMAINAMFYKGFDANRRDIYMELLGITILVKNF